MEASKHSRTGRRLPPVVRNWKRLRCQRMLFQLGKDRRPLTAYGYFGPGREPISPRRKLKNRDRERKKLMRPQKP